MPERTRQRVLAALGSAMMLAGVATLFTAAQSPALAAKHRNAPTTAITCTNQHHRDDPTTSQHQALDSYWFDIQPSGAQVCDLFAHVGAGDIVTANFTAASGASPQLTLVSYVAPAKSTGLGQTF